MPATPGNWVRRWPRTQAARLFRFQRRARSTPPHREEERLASFDGTASQPRRVLHSLSGVVNSWLIERIYCRDSDRSPATGPEDSTSSGALTALDCDSLSW